MSLFRAKKHLGQHFLKDKNIARKVVNALTPEANQGAVVELGPGKGILTEFLVQKYAATLHLVEIDPELATYLQSAYPILQDRIIAADFLQLALDQLWSYPLTIIGNFPYNLSSPIFFKILAHRQQVHEVVGMVQKEVAERLVASPSSKAYGIPSVFLQAFYTIKCLFAVGPQVFTPPPQVQSAVVHLKRNNRQQLDCNEELFFKVVKAGFQQRRKTLRNALKPLIPETLRDLAVFNQRAEQLTINDFVAIAKLLNFQ